MGSRAACSTKRVQDNQGYKEEPCLEGKKRKKERKEKRGWRNGSESAGCSSRGPEFESQPRRLTTIYSEIWCPWLVCRRNAARKLYIINKSLKKLKKGKKRSL